MSGRKVVKQACDGCKIRKIKCSGLTPCEGCQATGIACTFVKQPAARGPRSLRKNTLREIAQTQQQWERMTAARLMDPQAPRGQETESEFAPAKIAALVLQLCVYRLRMYPIWPIIKMERLVASLQRPDPDIEVLSLGYAVAAATIARIAPKATSHPGGVSAATMEELCQMAKARRNPNQPPDLTTVRIPLFLHFYYETLEPGGLQSVTFLREAIAVAHMIGLHRESYYQNVQPEEQEIRRRTLWLLFVTERGVSISHKLPVIIKTRIAFPSLNDTDEPEVLRAYQKLVSMFWDFDEAGVFDLLDSQDFDLTRIQSQPAAQNEAFASVRKRLDDSSGQTQSMNEVQLLDILVTRQWMKIIIWRLAESYGFFTHGLQNGSDQLDEPIKIAKELLETVSRADNATLEAHGTSLETKIFEVASTVADVIDLETTMSPTPGVDKFRPAQDILLQLYGLLSKNQTLAGMLFEKMKRLQPSVNLELQPEIVPNREVESAMAWDIDRQLQQHGFHFTEAFTGGCNPGDFPSPPDLQDAFAGTTISSQSASHPTDGLLWHMTPDAALGQSPASYAQGIYPTNEWITQDAIEPSSTGQRSAALSNTSNDGNALDLDQHMQ